MDHPQKFLTVNFYQFMIVRKYDPKLLVENGDPLSLVTSWPNCCYIYKMDYVKRKDCFTKKTIVHDFESIKVNF